jgi:uroporphyrinogen decarboxylase
MNCSTATMREHALGVLSRRTPGDFAIDFDFEPAEELVHRLKTYYRTDDLESILDRFGVEFRNTVVFTSAAIPAVPAERGYVRNAWGVLYDRRLGDVVEHPLNAVKTFADLDAYAYLDPDKVDYDRIEARAEKYNKQGTYCVYGGYWAPITYIAQQLVGMDRYMMLFYDDFDLINHLLDIIVEISLEINTRIFDRLGDAMQVYYIGDDYGTQLNPMTSMDFWRTLVKPHLKRIIDHAKNRGYAIQFHSCGSIEPLIDDFVELGVDCLNPIQVAARNMEPKYLATRHAHHITFNGGIDTQQVLPMGSPFEVRKVVRDTIEAMSVAGGYVLAPSQSFLPDIPVENIVAMYEEGVAVRDSRL